MPAKGYIILTCQYHKEGRNWVATCIELGTSTFGHTLEDAEKKLEEAMQLHLNTLEDVGEYQQFFEEHGIVFRTTKPHDWCINNIPTTSNVFYRPCIRQIGELTPA